MHPQNTCTCAHETRMCAAYMKAVDNSSADHTVSSLPLFCVFSLHSYGPVSRVGRDEHRVRGRVQVHVFQVVGRHRDDLLDVLVHPPAVGITDTAVLDV